MGAYQRYHSGSRGKARAYHADVSRTYMGEDARQFYAQWASPRAKYSGVMWQCKL